MKKKNVIAKLLMLGLVASSLVGCGGGSGNNTPGGPGGSTLFQPSVNADGSVNYPFTATSYLPYSQFGGSVSYRFLAGVFPSLANGNCNIPATSDRYGNPVLYWCNARVQPNSSFPPVAVIGRNYNVPLFTNNVDFGSVVPSLSSFAGQQSQKSIYGYSGYSSYSETPSTITLSASPSQSQVACPAYYQQQNLQSCLQVSVSGTIRLSAQYVRENLPAGPNLQRIAIDLDLTTLGGIIYLMSASSGNSNVIMF